MPLVELRESYATLFITILFKNYRGGNHNNKDAFYVGLHSATVLFLINLRLPGSKMLQMVIRSICKLFSIMPSCEGIIGN